MNMQFHRCLRLTEQDGSAVRLCLIMGIGESSADEGKRQKKRPFLSL